MWWLNLRTSRSEGGSKGDSGGGILGKITGDESVVICGDKFT